MKTLFIISTTALVIAVGMSAFLYMEVQKLKEINDVEYWHNKNSMYLWKNWQNYELDHWEMSEQQYKKKWTEQIRKSQQLDQDWKNDMDRLLYP